jgi:hypothetical protein
MEDNEDLFDNYESLPELVKEVILTFSDNSYAECVRLEAELKQLGYTFDWGLDAEPFNLRLI